MKSEYFYFYAGSMNHGCEAIVRATASLLKTKPILVSDHPEQDKRYRLEQVVVLREKAVFNPTFFEKVGCYLTVHAFKSDQYGYERRAHSEAQAFAPGSTALSIGGDNYCYGEAYNIYLAALNRQLHKRGLKTVLWGCSIEPASVTKAMQEDFSRYDLIVARESISFGSLKKYNTNTVKACDPAFILEPEATTLPDDFIPGKTVGMNLSPLIQKREPREGITLENYYRLAAYIIEETDYHIALIPHVVCPGNDDRTAMQPLYERYKDTGRICIVQDGNCQKLKWIISKCSLFVGARTHATIAAYSTGVPTLVIGYSTKARGIAKDLFGSEEHYVLPVQTLQKRDDLLNAFVWLDEHQTEISKHLVDIMPEYKKTVAAAAAELQNL